MSGSANLSDLESSLGYFFRDRGLLREALRHPSINVNKEHEQDYERLELLGDSILSFIITEIIFINHKNYTEGDLAKVRSCLVCKDALFLIATDISLSKYITMSDGEEKSGGRDNPNNLENSLEAILAAIYLDSNIEAVRGVIKRLWDKTIHNVDIADADPKSYLQELVQAQNMRPPLYKLISKTGEAHSPEFEVSVVVNKLEMTAVGTSIKSAEKMAARMMIKKLRDK
jgi:ribonuclease III